MNENISIDENHCFLCNEQFSEKRRKTMEHVFPQWLLNDFKIRNSNISLLNRTLIKYDKLKIPCCNICNELMSKKIEKPIKEAVKKGYNEFVKLDKDIVFYWLLKLQCGILYKETSLKHERSKSNSETILDKTFITEDYITNYNLLKTITRETKFYGRPYSLLIFNVNNIMPDNYWVQDIITIDTYFMMINDIGIIISFSDNGVIENIFMSIKENKNLLNCKLDTRQFLEICAQYFYKKSTCEYDPLILFLDDESEIHVLCVKPSIKYKKYNVEDYASVFLFFQKDLSDNLKKEDILVDGKVITFINYDNLLHDKI